MAQPTVSVILSELLSILKRHICPKWIQFNYTQEEERWAKIYFFEKSRIPNVVGAIDGTHIKIIGPNKDLQHVYYNRKGYYSINAMLVCDHLMYIRCVNAKHRGSSHDASVWSMSQLKVKLEGSYRNGRTNFRILGDGGYPLSPYLITPYRNVEESSLQANFNKKHAQGRNIIERTIGVLKSRFRCLLQARELHYTAKKATKIFNVCAALHNICVKYRLENPEAIEEESENVLGNHDMLDDSAIFTEGSRIRDSIARFMQTE
ncbi:putative nuclease HARBI1 [Eupeodes corollae]|uniref:putative nuclease HARBI1 n=1 Tax=Eupeodes corollae TaxID=290404 RepID=UPI002492E413|nr:putative nuclease HARBI1 [Eupeodes corollae]